MTKGITTISVVERIIRHFDQRVRDITAETKEEYDKELVACRHEAIDFAGAVTRQDYIMMPATAAEAGAAAANKNGHDMCHLSPSHSIQCARICGLLQNATCHNQRQRRFRAICPKEDDPSADDTTARDAARKGKAAFH